MRVKRPGAATAAGVMCIVAGCLLSLCHVLGFAGAFLDEGLGMGAPGGADMKKFMNDNMPGYVAFQLGGSTVGLLEGILFLVSGIGILNLSRWARGTAIAVICVFMVTTIAATVYQIVVISPVMTRFFRQAMPPAAGVNFGGLTSFMNAVTIGVAVVYLIYVVIVLCLLLQKHVGEAFARSHSGDFEKEWDDGVDRDERDDRRRDEHWDDRDDRPRDDGPGRPRGESLPPPSGERDERIQSDEDRRRDRRRDGYDEDY